jgi:hypothetical protein
MPVFLNTTDKPKDKHRPYKRQQTEKWPVKESADIVTKSPDHGDPTNTQPSPTPRNIGKSRLAEHQRIEFKPFRPTTTCGGSQRGPDYFLLPGRRLEYAHMVTWDRL